MKYGMTFIIELYDADKQEAHRILTMPGDYIRTSRWAEESLKQSENDTVNSLMRNYATVWHALKRRGQLSDFGLPAQLTEAAIEAMADRFTVFVVNVEEDSLPLAGEPPK